MFTSRAITGKGYQIEAFNEGTPRGLHFGCGIFPIVAKVHLGSSFITAFNGDNHL
jgi:hypothetical protein